MSITEKSPNEEESQNSEPDVEQMEQNEIMEIQNEINKVKGNTHSNNTANIQN